MSPIIDHDGDGDSNENKTLRRKKERNRQEGQHAEMKWPFVYDKSSWHNGLRLNGGLAWELDILRGLNGYPRRFQIPFMAHRG